MGDHKPGRGREPTARSASVTDQLSSSSRSIPKQVPVNLSAFDLVIIDSGRNDVIEHGDEYTDYRLTPATRQVNPRSLEQPGHVLQDMVAQIRIWRRGEGHWHHAKKQRWATEDFNLLFRLAVVSMNSWSSACFGSRFVSIEGRLGDIRGGLGNTAYYTGRRAAPQRSRPAVSGGCRLPLPA